MAQTTTDNKMNTGSRDEIIVTNTHERKEMDEDIEMLLGGMRTMRGVVQIECSHTRVQLDVTHNRCSINEDNQAGKVSKQVSTSGVQLYASSISANVMQYDYECCQILKQKNDD